MEWIKVLLDELDRSKGESSQAKPSCELNEAHLLAPKHKAIVMNIVEKLPPEVTEHAKKDILFVSDPKLNIKGMNMSLGKDCNPPSDIVWLNPKLWKEEDKEIQHVVLHEIAHSYLGHSGEADVEATEQEEANNKVEEWIEYAKNTRG